MLNFIKPIYIMGKSVINFFVCLYILNYCFTLNLKIMKKDTVISLVVGGVLMIAGGVLAYFKREEIKDIAGKVADEVKNRLPKKNVEEPAPEEA